MSGLRTTFARTRPPARAVLVALVSLLLVLLVSATAEAGKGWLRRNIPPR